MLWIRTAKASPAAALILINFRPYPDRWVLYAQGGTLVLMRERSILDPAEAQRAIKSSPDKHAFLGFARERWQQFHNWPVNTGTITYGTVYNAYSCPLWASVLLFLILPLVELPRMIRNFNRRRRGLCLNCGYDLRASPNKCPECGKVVLKKFIAQG